jgi:hypothetical protein
LRILLDENLPEGLIEPLRRLEHLVDSVGSLRLKGIDNGRLYREVVSGYDLFFTKDREFAARVERLADTSSVSVVLTLIRQQPEAQFVAVFMAAFIDTDWSDSAPVREWPGQGFAGG